MSERKPRPLWPLLTAALVLLPVLYVASFGLACRFFPTAHRAAIYRPCWIIVADPTNLGSRSLRYWVGVCAGDESVKRIDRDAIFEKFYGQ